MPASITADLDGGTNVTVTNGDFTDEQRARIADIAKRCPVRRTPETGIHFVDEVHVG